MCAGVVGENVGISKRLCMHKSVHLNLPVIHDNSKRSLASKTSTIICMESPGLPNV